MGIYSRLGEGAMEMIWCTAEHIVSTDSEIQDDLLEELAVLFLKAAKICGHTVDFSRGLIVLKDADRVDEWAEDLAWQRIESTFDYLCAERDATIKNHTK